ncbi:hypothetical protein ACLB1M_28960 [Escherichia coli]
MRGWGCGNHAGGAVGLLGNVENNQLGGSEWLQTEKAREHGAYVLSCSDNPSGEACKRGQAENKLMWRASRWGCSRGVPKLWSRYGNCRDAVQSWSMD